ncbi:proteasome stabiliser-domain-containing protein [Exophiala viscosa]|uniref:Proteasome stabiliser-domain-containing protein n=1 Tax=Exophiala viscosa TaxID=2486360 RepID=A0AAN6IE09_9EURO|nr:proteasome stabiliser-domain-containing protein [Exophiala viscosa]
MAATSPAPADAEREYNLISQLELRIASASTDTKLESILLRFLPALMLKLASPVPKNRELALKVCSYVYQRLKISTDIQLPVAALVKTYSEATNVSVSQFGLLYIQLGLPRLKSDQAIETLPGVLQFSIPKEDSHDSTSTKMWSIAFGFLLEVLRQWKLPERGSKEEIALKETFSLTPPQTDHLARRINDFIFYDPKNPHTQPENADILAVYNTNYKRRSEVVPPLAKFLCAPLFTDQQRFIPAVIMSVDANAAALTTSDIMFKQFNFDFEDEQNVDALFTLYDRSRPKLQTRILTLLSRSQKSTTRPEKVLSLVQEQLHPSSMTDGSSAAATGLEAAKLRSALFSYLTWVVRVGQHLGNISHRVQDLLKEYIEGQGWPAMTDRSSAAEMELRAKAYESIGLLAAVKKDTPGNDPEVKDRTQDLITWDDAETNTRTLDLITWLFTSLRCDTTRDIRGSVEEAIGRVMNTVTNLDDQSMSRLKQLLLWNVLALPGQEDPIYYFTTVNSTRYPAVRFANKCLPFHDVDARFMNVLALASSDRREVSEEGIRGLDPYWHASNARLVGVSARDEKLLLPDLDQLVTRFFEAEPEQVKCYDSHTVLAAAVTFCRNVLVCNALSSTTHKPEESADWNSSIDALVNNDQDVRVKIRGYLQELALEPKLTLLRAALSGASKGSGECLEIALQLLSLAPNDVLPYLEQAGLETASKLASNAGLQIRAARIFGILASTSDDVETLARTELEHCQNWKTAVGEEANKFQGHLLRACFCLTRRALRGGAEPAASSQQNLVQLISDIVQSSSNKTLKETAFRCLRQLALCTPTAEGPSANDEILKPMIAEAKKESEVAVSALGPLLGILYTKGQTIEFESLFDRILALHEVKRAEFHFALGESLAVACAGFRSSSTMTEFDVDADLPSWGFNEKLMSLILDRVVEDCRTTKPSQKKAAAIWLLCIIQYCGEAEPIKSKLRDCQATFARLLNDRDEIVQETGSRGLSLVYEQGDKQLRDDLVRDLVQSFTGSKAKMSGSVSEDTQLFETGALPTENGQSVTTYKDIVSLATEMGDPSLVYKFMNLASSNAIWSSRAAFGRFGLGNILADSTYLAENKKFYPKLFRYRFDPNPNVQRSMKEIWRALVKDTSAVISDNFDLIMDDLLKSVVSGKEWRAREASCAAIADLVQGREVEKFEKYLDDIWKVAFKVLDDVKESVRAAAMKLCRTLTSMLIRNLETGDGNTKRSATMLNHAMPFLIQQMEGGAGQDVQQYAIVTLLEIVKKCPSKSLRPYGPLILETLVVSLSSLEHESINYLHLNADKYGLTTEKLDKMRVSSINASPVTEAIERCLDSITTNTDSPETASDAMEGVTPTSKTREILPPMEDAMQRLVNAYRAAIGLPSKVGLSRVMITLVVRHQAAFRPYADRFVQVTRKHLLDRNATISVAFSTALGYLMRLASPKEVQATSSYAQKLYFESQDLVHRSVAGEMIQAISKASNDVFMNSASIFLPFAFIGRRDTDKEVAERFDVPWKENIGGSRSVNLYLSEIVGLISTHIKSPLWPIKHACCFAVAELVSIMENNEKYSDKSATIVWSVVQEALDGKTWEGKEDIIKVYPKFVRQAQVLWSDNKVSQQMRKIAIREAKRTNVSYRPHAIGSLGEFADVRKDMDLTGDLIPYLSDTLDEVTDEDAMDVDGANGKTFEKRTVNEVTASAIVSCMFKILASHPETEVLDQTIAIVRKAQATRSSEVDSALYTGAKFFVDNCGKQADVAGVDSEMKGINKENASASDVAPASSKGDSAGSEDGQRLHEPFEPLVLAVLAGGDARQANETENLRRDRVALAVALAERGPRMSVPLAAILDNWSQTERSRPLREDIDRARLLTKRNH